MFSVLRLSAVVLLAGAIGARAANVWQLTSGTNDWYGDTNNWSLTHFPQAGEDVLITNAGVSVVLSSAAPSSGWLNSVVVSNTATLIFSNWDTTLSATDVTIKTNAIVTCAGPFTDTDMSNRVYLVCSNLTVETGGKINVDYLGYAGGNSSHTNGYGPGGGKTSNGGSHGGFGGIGFGGSSISAWPYGNALAPECPGSGGGMVSAGHGGGAVRIVAPSGTVTVNGTISANGQNYLVSARSSGSGGSIYITCRTLAGTGGVIQANGGQTPAWGANGAGGRIAVHYDQSAQSNAPSAAIGFSVLPGGPLGNVPSEPGMTLRADLGTVYFPDTSLLREPINVSAQLILGVPAWTTDSLTVSNNWVRFVQDGFQLMVSNDVTIQKGNLIGRLEVGAVVMTNFVVSTSGGNPAISFRHFGLVATSFLLRVGGNLTLTNSGSLVVYSAMTNANTPGYGALVDVTGDVLIGSIGCWVYAYSHWTNGAGPLFRMRSLFIGATNAGFNANYAGYGVDYDGIGYGPGKGAFISSYPKIGGGCYGGLGGNMSDTGKIYGSSNAPTLPGSPGYTYAGGCGGFGGGLIRIESRGVITLNGTITADGFSGSGGYSTSGSGGGVYLQCRRFVGSATGVIQAKGANESGDTRGGGGGGRIAVWRIFDYSPGGNGALVISNSVSGGTSGTPVASNGTIVWGWIPTSGTLILLR